ncbi:MAG: transposase [Phycisphaeraceae bacterium]|nr:transposase [Phycisphaeraceae bacterium]MBX3361586.1 transposase [Phycisphaeraceae bacterium]
MHRREGTGSPRFLTFSCYRREQLFHPTIASLFADALAAARVKHGFALHAWVVMPEHVHLLITPPRELDVGHALRSIKLPVAIEAIKRWDSESALPEIERRLPAVHTPRGTPRFWQPGGGFDHNVRTEASLIKTINYIHKNPVERELVTAADQWPWSSIHWWLARHGCSEGHALHAPAVVCDLPRGTLWSRWKPRIDRSSDAPSV